MEARYLTIVPEHVKILEGDDLKNKLEELTEKGVLHSYPSLGSYLGTARSRYSNRDVIVEFDNVSIISSGVLSFNKKYTGTSVYLGSDNRLYPTSNDKREIRRLVIPVD